MSDANNNVMSINDVITQVSSEMTLLEAVEKIDVMMIVHSLIGCVGIVANFTIIIVFGNHKKFRQKIPNIFIVHQSCLDFAASIILLISTLTVRDHYTIEDQGILGWMQCHMWNTKFLLWALFGSSTWNIVSLTFERYLELVHTMWHKVHFKKRWMYTGFVINWVVGLIFNAAYLIPTTKLTSGTCILSAFWPSVLFGKIFAAFLFGLEYFFPLMILVYCYGRIVWVLTRRMDSNLGNNIPVYTTHGKSNNCGKYGEDSGKNLDTFQLARRNTIKTFILVGVCFILCLSNAHIYYFMYNLGYDLDYNGTYYQFTVLMVFFNCTVNPFIYLIKYKDYQIALKEFLGCKKLKKGEDPDTKRIHISTPETTNVA